MILFGLGTVAYVKGAATPQRTVSDFIADAKRPGASMQVGTYSPTYEIACHWLGIAAGVGMTVIPYKGLSAVVTELAGRQIYQRDCLLDTVYLPEALRGLLGHCGHSAGNVCTVDVRRSTDSGCACASDSIRNVALYGGLYQTVQSSVIANSRRTLRLQSAVTDDERRRPGCSAFE